MVTKLTRCTDLKNVTSETGLDFNSGQPPIKVTMETRRFPGRRHGNGMLGLSGRRGDGETHRGRRTDA
jgi:hypothetical protein